MRIVLIAVVAGLSACGISREALKEELALVRRELAPPRQIEVTGGPANNASPVKTTTRGGAPAKAPAAPPPAPAPAPAAPARDGGIPADWVPFTVLLGPATSLGGPALITYMQGASDPARWQEQFVVYSKQNVWLPARGDVGLFLLEANTFLTVRGGSDAYSRSVVISGFRPK